MGRAFEAAKRYLRIIIAVAILPMLFPLNVVSAADPVTPDTFQIVSVEAMHNLIEDDDFLLAFTYNIQYDAGQPTTPASDLFHFRLMDTDGTTQLGAVAPYPYYNSGYDMGVSAFYFSAAAAPTWEEAYKLRIEGNPKYWSSSPAVSYTLVTSDYSQLDGQDENRTLLGNYLVDTLRDLEINWDTKMVAESDLGTILSSTGETYLRGTINGIQTMCPQIFAVQTSTPDFEETAWTGAQGESYKTRYDGTWIGNSLQKMEDELHVPWNVLTGIGILGLILGLFVLSYAKFSTTTPALISGAAVFLMGAVMGFIAPAIMALTGLTAGGFLVYIFFFRHG